MPDTAPRDDGAYTAVRGRNPTVPDVSQINEVLGLASRVREAGGWLLRLLRQLRRKTAADDPAPGDWQSRSLAYRRFQDAALNVFLNLQYLATVGTPPRLAGALWTWPSAIRAWRRVLDSLNESLGAIYEMAIIGDHGVLDAAVSVGEMLGQMASQFPARRGGGSLPPEFASLVDDAGQRLLDFAASARADLQKKP